jgi:hypothetical protein
MVAKSKGAETRSHPSQTFAGRMRIGWMGIGCTNDFSEKHECRIIEIVFLQKRIEGDVFAVMPEFAILNVEWNRPQLRRSRSHLGCRGEKELGVWINEFFDQPRTSDSVHFDFFAGNPFHNYFPAGARSKNKPASARTIPARRANEAGSLKNRIPAAAMIAAPPARIIGTEDSGPPF